MNIAVPAVRELAAQYGPAVLERMVYIDFRVYFLGELRRIDLMTRFGQGSAAATRDIATYKRDLGGQIELDQATKTYRPSRRFRPVFEHRVDQVLLGLSRGFGETNVRDQRALIPCDVPQLLCLPRPEILAPITRAIHRRNTVRIAYNSFSSGVTRREIVPFALGDNGLRWHVRAFDRRRKKFVDFVLTRITAAEELLKGTINDDERAASDWEWSQVVELELVPHPKEPSPNIIALDYAMESGVRRIRVRAAIACYLLRQWIVDCSPNHSLTGPEFRLWLRNNPILYGLAGAHLAPGWEPTQLPPKPRRQASRKPAHKQRTGAAHHPPQGMTSQS